ncbi:MAG: SGNH/GDSL hydrolase family protein [Bryobacteraceae bacterium]
MKKSILLTTLLGTLAALTPASATAQNLVIVSMGDSLAAGEGNPNSFSIAGAVWSSAPCHRSVNNGRRFASDRMNDLANLSTSFFDFSCSGASIDAGILGSQLTSQPDANNGSRTPQIDQVVNALGRVPGTTRTDAVIDIVMISIGVNDVNFASVVTECLLPNGITDCTTSAAVNTSRNVLASGAFAAAYDRLGAAIRAKLPNARHVYITEYPIEMTSAAGNFCGNVDDGSGDASMVGVSATENEFLFTNILLVLNDRVQQAAGRNGWTFVRGPEDTFATHGYCTSLQRRYLNTLSDSFFRQGNQNGTMHPNIAGHKAYADALIARATLDFNLHLESPRVTRKAEINVGVPAPLALPAQLALPGVKKAVQFEIGQHPGTLTVTLQHRVLNPPVCVPVFGCTTPPVPAFSNTAMADAGAGRLNLFSATIPGSEFLLPTQTLEYRAVITATRNGETRTVTTSKGTIVLGDALVR